MTLARAEMTLKTRRNERTITLPARGQHMLKPEPSGYSQFACTGRCVLSSPNTESELEVLLGELLIGGAVLHLAALSEVLQTVGPDGHAATHEHVDQRPTVCVLRGQVGLGVLRELLQHRLALA